MTVSGVAVSVILMLQLIYLNRFTRGGRDPRNEPSR